MEGVEDKFRETVSALGYPIMRQGSLSESEEYPGSFFTFWNNSADGAAYYDNSESQTIWDFDLNFYSVDPELTYSILLDAKEALKKAGFVVAGKGYDVPSDEVTHTGRGMNVLFLET